MVWPPPCEGPADAGRRQNESRPGGAAPSFSQLMARARVLDEAALREEPPPLPAHARADQVHAAILAGACAPVKGRQRELLRCVKPSVLNTSSRTTAQPRARRWLSISLMSRRSPRRRSGGPDRSGVLRRSARRRSRTTSTEALPENARLAYS